MSKDVIKVEGEEVVVREDTAKAYRGVNWALVSVAGFILIAALLLIYFFIIAAKDGQISTPATIENNERR